MDAGEITASISATGTVTFADPVQQQFQSLSKAEVDQALAQAQAQSQLLIRLERELNLSKDYIAKALKHKDEAWGGQDEEMYNVQGGGGWGEDF